MSGALASVAARIAARGWVWAAVLGGHAAATLLLASGSVAGGGPARALLPYTAVAVGVLASHGVVAGPLRTGEMLLWLQKPLSATGLIARWLGEVVAITAAATMLAVLVTGLATGPGLAHLGPAALAWGTAAAVVGFGVSATGLRPDGVLSVLWIFVAGPFLLLGAAGGGAAAPLAELLAYPYQHLDDLTRALPAGGPAAAGPAARVLLHVAAWGAAGVLLGGLRCRCPAGLAGGR